MPNLAMRLPGTLFSGDGVDISWPIGGEREVVAVDDADVSLRIRQRIAEGNIVITDDAPTKTPDEPRQYRLLTGDEAREHMAEPAGPVTRVVYEPGTSASEQEYQLEVKSVQTDSPAYIAAQKAAAEDAEVAHAAITQQQVDAEQAAQKDAEKAAAEALDEDEDPLAATKRRTLEANDSLAAERDVEFMERETERQKIEAEDLKQFDARAKAHSDAKPDKAAVEADAAFMTAETARQKSADKADKEAAKTAAKADDDDTIPVAVAGRTDPYVAVSTVSRKGSVGVIPNDTRDNPVPPAKAKAGPKSDSGPKADAESTSKPNS